METHWQSILTAIHPTAKNSTEEKFLDVKDKITMHGQIDPVTDMPTRFEQDSS